MSTEKKDRMKFPYDWLYEIIRQHLKISATEFKYILINNVFKSNNRPEIQNLFRRLRSKELIKKHHRGVYYPTDKLYAVKNLLRFIDPTKLYFELYFNLNYGKKTTAKCQKAYNRLRLEISANRLKYFIMGKNLTEKRHDELFDRSFVRGLKDSGLDIAILTEKKERVNFPYDWLYEIVRQHLKINATEFIYVLINNEYKSNSSPKVQRMFRRLVSKKLIKKHHRGVYYPSDKLYEVKNLLRFIEPMMLSYNVNQTKMFPFEYNMSFDFDPSKDPMETFEQAVFFSENFKDSLIFHQK